MGSSRGSGAGNVWRVSGLRQEVDEPDEAVLARAARQIGLDPGQLAFARLAKRSVDARGRGADLHFVVQVDLAGQGPIRSQKFERLRRSGKVREAPTAASLRVESAGRPGGASGGAVPHVVVVGAGPGGLFAALGAAESGARVTLLERGEPIERRGRKVVAFHRGGEPDPDNNLLFGDGGAGTYSDGKLYTRVSDPMEFTVIQELIDAGAPPDIAYDARAHIGTDRLHRMLPRLRARLEAAGVEFRYGIRVTGLVRSSGARSEARIRAVATTEGEIPLDALVLCIGHSARDTWARLLEDGVLLEAKPFQLGVRIEHPQELITRGRYGPEIGDGLGPASYNLQSKGAPPAHSFCMCPGGRIVASVNEPRRLCTNGMSNSKHSSRWANAALVTTLTPEDFASFGFEGPLAGVELQRHLEERFFVAGGETYQAPAQRADDFLEGRLSGGELKTSYGFGAVPGRIDELLPPQVRDAIREALGRFDRTIPGFGGPEGLLVGIETRSSGPVRMTRDRESRRALGFENLFPAGEGAGYAGGIMSAAIDGARSAQSAVLEARESLSKPRS
ncbi:tricarballylate dehydrogenase [Planctomycetes bacterium Poly30]|uniref:Tricarballylate dehydrogenase n=1 Tax=Saltatorellus ferox TaxID=2528018 RepID=A0A518ETP2_9BACT|nr:tricarballylate dehydrogenase [Planctomycetes bacterium Poly30]